MCQRDLTLHKSIMALDLGNRIRKTWSYLNGFAQLAPGSTLDLGKKGA